MQYLVPMWKHQQNAFERATRPGVKNFALFMEMGTGKTATTINILRHLYYANKKVLRTVIFCPIVVCVNWQREFRTHSKVGDSVVVLTGTGKKRAQTLRKIIDNDGPQKIIVTNYETLTMKEVYHLLKEFHPTVMIADESQRLKNAKAIRTKLAIELADTATYKYILTGTPILNNPMDLFGQFKFLDGGASFGRNFVVFRAHYFFDKNAGMPSDKYFPNWQPRPGAYMEMQQKVFTKSIHVKKKDCLDLPPIIRQRVYVPFAPDQAKAYEEMKRDFITYLDSKACVAQMALIKALRLQQITSGFIRTDERPESECVYFKLNPRLSALRDLLAEDIPATEKVIVWCVFRDNYAPIQQMLEKEKISYRILVGGMSDKQRQTSIDDFQNDPTVRVILANQQAGGVGVSLVAASYAVYYSRNFSLEADLQSEARNHRSGSEVHEKITRIDLVAPETIDEIVLDALHRKESLANSILTIGSKL